MDRCQNCRFWAAAKKSLPPWNRTSFHDTEYCRRFPEYQFHHKDDWCGEHRPKGQTNAK